MANWPAEVLLSTETGLTGFLSKLLDLLLALVKLDLELLSICIEWMPARLGRLLVIDFQAPNNHL